MDHQETRIIERFKLSRGRADKGEEPEPDFWYHVEAVDSVVLLALHGEFDGTYYESVYADLVAAFHDPESKDLLVDMSQLRYIDSRSLGVLVHVMHLVRDREGSIYVADCCPSIRRALAVTRLDRIFRIVDTTS